MSKIRLLFFLFVISFTSGLLANPDVSIENNIFELCQTYRGGDLQLFIDPMSGTLANPLTTSKLGQRIWMQTAKSSFKDFKYFSQSGELKEIINYPLLDQALDRCYPNQPKLRSNFLFFLHSLDTDAKAAAAKLQVAGFFLSTAMANQIFGRISLYLTSRFVSYSGIITGTFKWSQRVATAAALIALGKVLYKLYEYKVNGVSNKKNLTFEPMLERAKAENDMILEQMKILEPEIRAELVSLQEELRKEKDPAKILVLKDLIRESQNVLARY